MPDSSVLALRQASSFGGWWEKVSFYWFKCAEIAIPLWVGGVAVGLALAIPSYYITLFGVRYYRMKRWGQLMPPKHD